MEKKLYIVPTLTVVEFKVEHGYGTSFGQPDHTFFDLFNLESSEPGYNHQNQENWSESNDGGSIFSW